jgi:hypothetical protein
VTHHPMEGSCSSNQGCCYSNVKRGGVRGFKEQAKDQVNLPFFPNGSVRSAEAGSRLSAEAPPAGAARTKRAALTRLPGALLCCFQLGKECIEKWEGEPNGEPRRAPEKTRAQNF